MNRIKNLISLSIFSLLVMGLPAIASAQNRDRDRDRDDDRYGNYGGYGNNGQNGKNGYYGDLRSTVRDLKNRTKELQRHLDDDLDRSRHNGTQREDQLNAQAKDFRRAVNRLSESNSGRNDDNAKVQNVLNLGSQLDRSLSRTRLDRHVSDIWSGIRNDLRVLGNAYGYNDNYRNNRYPTNNRYPDNNRGNTNGRNNLPSWWPF